MGTNQLRVSLSFKVLIIAPWWSISYVMFDSMVIDFVMWVWCPWARTLGDYGELHPYVVFSWHIDHVLMECPRILVWFGILMTWIIIFYEVLGLLHVKYGIWTLEDFLLGCSSSLDVVHTYGWLIVDLAWSALLSSTWLVALHIFHGEPLLQGTWMASWLYNYIC